jgi:hypothetical protein
MKIETLKVLAISTTHITAEDGKLLIERTYNSEDGGLPSPFQFTPATDEYSHWIWAGTPGEESSLECQCASAEDEGYSSYFTDILRIAYKNGCSHVRLDRDGPVYDELPVLDW